MTGNEFIRGVRRLGRKRDVEVYIDSKRGKGSHEVLYYGRRRTIVRNLKDELKKGTLHTMLHDLELNLDDFQ